VLQPAFADSCPLLSNVSVMRVLLGRANPVTEVDRNVRPRMAGGAGAEPCVGGGDELPGTVVLGDDPLPELEHAASAHASRPAATRRERVRRRSVIGDRLRDGVNRAIRRLDRASSG